MAPKTIANNRLAQPFLILLTVLTDRINSGTPKYGKSIRLSCQDALTKRSA